MGRYYPYNLGKDLTSIDFVIYIADKEVINEKSNFAGKSTRKIVKDYPLGHQWQSRIFQVKRRIASGNNNLMEGEAPKKLRIHYKGCCRRPMWPDSVRVSNAAATVATEFIEKSKLTLLSLAGVGIGSQSQL